MYICKKNDIKVFPFQEAAHLAEPELEEWITSHGIHLFSLWMMPQIQAYFGSLKVSKNAKGLYDPKALMVDNFKGNDWAVGLWRVCTKAKRSLIVKSQTEMPEYSALVPLILSGLKKYKNIGYEEWDRDGIEHTLSKDLAEAMLYEAPTLSVDRLMEIRSHGLMNKSGPKVGTLKKSTSTWKLTGIKHTELGEAPNLAVVMLTQIWVAHVSIRNKYMVLDPVNWDNMPSPLIEGSVLLDTPAMPSTKASTKVDKLPWE